MKRGKIPYSPEELDWIKTRATMDRREMHAQFCSRFARTDVSLQNLNALCKRNGWLTGRTGRFAKGLIPANKGQRMPFNANSAKTQFKKGHRAGRARALYKPVGTERITRAGYVERKINDDLPLQARWRAVHLIRWEAANGPVPDGHCLKCIDGDKTNTDPSNWLSIPRALLPRLNGRWVSLSYDAAEPELRPYLLAVAKLHHATREARKGKPSAADASKRSADARTIRPQETSNQLK